MPVLVPAEALRELHALHLNLDDARLQLERGPKQLQARRQHMQRKKQEVEQAEEELKRLRMLADQKELHLKSNEQKIADLQVRLNAVKTNREYQAIRDQVDADKMANSVLEDEILETYSRIDEHRTSLQTAEEELNRATQETQEMEETVAQQSRRLASRMKELEEMLVRAVEALPLDARDIYARLVAARGADAMAAVEGDSCTGCYTAITPQMYNELLMNQLVCCKSCGRLLYLAK
jgi:predicted  nucleic acid-binding Zn-ribbon protein